MSDIGLFWNSELGAADFAVVQNDLATDDGLETSVFLSLFTDRRADDNDVLPDGDTDRRGWWGDAVAVVEGDKHGSRLWLLARSKQTQETIRRAEEYAREALAWLVEDRVAARVDVTAEVVRTGVLGLTVTIYRPRTDVTTYRYDFNWAAQEAKRAA
jgi:phage gp46-like protein